MCDKFEVFRIEKVKGKKKPVVKKGDEPFRWFPELEQLFKNFRINKLSFSVPGGTMHRKEVIFHIRRVSIENRPKACDVCGSIGDPKRKACDVCGSAERKG